MTPAERLSGRMPTAGEIDAIARQTLRRLPSPFADSLGEVVLLFEDLDLELGPGEALQVAGPNGSGKSSLIRLAASLLRAERGTVERSDAALADEHLALDRELPLGRALAFWAGRVDPALDALG